MNVALWTAQISLAVVFSVSGILKATWSKERLIASGQTGVKPFPTPVIRLTAVSELLAVVGLLVPWSTGVAPALTPVAAAGLCVVMIGAILSHGRLLASDRAAGQASAEARNIAITATLLAVCVFVVVGRL